MLAKRLLTTAVFLLSLAALATVASSAEAKRKPLRLKAFSSCSSLVGYGNRFASREAVPVWQYARSPQPTSGPPSGSGGGTAQPMPAAGQDESAAAPAAPERGTDFSGTNTQEEDVDEPDVVKTDGETVWAIAGTRLHAIDVRGGATTLLGSLDLPKQAWGAEMLVVGRRALVMWADNDYGSMPVARPASSMIAGTHRERTVLAEVDLSDPAALKLVRTSTVDGRLVASRLNGVTARVVLAATPRALEVPIETDSSTSEQRAALREAGSRRVRDWLPRRVSRKGGTGKPRVRPAVSCGAVRRPASFSGLDTVTVLTLDLSKSIVPIDSDGLMTDAETVYASGRSLYVATRRWIRAVDSPFPAPTDAEPPVIRTQIHRFDISDPGSTVYVGTGEVSGYLLNQFSLSEHEGVLRAATTDGPSWWPGDVGPKSESAVTTLEAKPGGLLATVGRVAGLGKGERIYAVRFIGKTGYVVTFRQTDPLYTIDVSDPANPRVLGELKILGYSAYLHPAGDGLLIGVGQDATEEGRRTGAQVSLFDVSDPANPRRLHQRSLGRYASSSAEFDHRAFLYWAPTNLLMLPVQVYSENDAFFGAVGFRVKRESGIDEISRVSHGDNDDYRAMVERSLVVGDRVLTLSQIGLKASRLNDLADAGWLAFPGRTDG